MTLPQRQKAMKRRLNQEQEPASDGGRVCPDCDLYRTANEFRIGSVEFENCTNCWAKHGRRKKR